MPSILGQFKNLKRLAISYQPGKDKLEEILPPSVEQLCLGFVAGAGKEVAEELASHAAKHGNLHYLEVYAKQGTAGIFEESTWDALVAKDVDVHGWWVKENL